MIKLIGALMILSAAGGFGVSRAVVFYRQVRLLRDFGSALEILKCELNYTLSPLPALCRVTAKRTSGPVSAFFTAYAQSVEKGVPRSRAAAAAMEGTKGLTLPNDAKMALLELFGALGRYDLDGENRLLTATEHRLRSAAERFDTEKRPLAKGYAILGLCAGVALVILFV